MSTEAEALARCGSWLLLGLVLGSSACRKSAPKLENHDDLSRARCASACASVSRCAADEPPLEAQARCLEQCSALREEAVRASCIVEQDRALACASTARSACERLTSARSALERGVGLAGCEAEFGALARCSAPCREAGVVRSATRRLSLSDQEVEVQAEQISLGCGPPSDLPSKAPPGSPCQHFSVCSPARCPCTGSSATYAARVCASGQCASAERACELAPRAVGYEPCKAP